MITQKNTIFYIQLLVASIGTLILGIIIYLVFRPSYLYYFTWFEKYLTNELILSLRNFASNYYSKLPSWFIYSLPNGLWLFSYTSIILLIWNNKIKKSNVHWFVLAPLYAIIYEIGQLFGWFYGVFDFFDIFFYILGVTLPILLFSNINLKKS